MMAKSVSNIGMGARLRPAAAAGGAPCRVPAGARGRFASRTGGSHIGGAFLSALVQAAQGEGEAGRAAQRSGEGASATGAGRAEFREMFVSLVDPAGLLDMEKCSRTAGLMADSASRSGYRAGARMASLLAGIFADMAYISNRPVEDGALGHTQIGFRHMIGVLYDTAEAYRDGGDAEPVGELEEARAAIAKLRLEADAYREYVRAAGPPGAGLSGLDRCYMGRLCRDVVRKAQEGVRERAKARGDDPIFPPEPKPIEFPDDGLNLSGLQTMQLMEGNIPDGYELVKVEELDELRRRAGRVS